MSLTDGIYGAGVPTETSRTVLVLPLKYTWTHNVAPNTLACLSHRTEICGFTALAAWEISYCQEQHRLIHYVFCYRNGRDGGKENPTSASWRIFDQIDVEWEFYEDMAQFLQHETVNIEKRPGGAQRQQIIGLAWSLGINWGNITK